MVSNFKRLCTLLLAFPLMVFAAEETEKEKVIEFSMPDSVDEMVPHEKDVVSFIAVRANPEEMKKIVQNGKGLSNMKEVDQMLKDNDYIGVLKSVWSEKDTKKKMAFLQAQANAGHPLFMLELGIENLKQTPTLENFISNAQPWLVSGIVRTQQDLECIDDPSAKTAVQALMIGYYREIDPILQGKYTQEEAEQFMQSHTSEMMENVNKKVNEVLDPSKSLPSAKWLSYHGLKAANGEPNMISGDCDAARKEFAKRIIEGQMSEKPE